jgi:hypothetical protein
VADVPCKKNSPFLRLHPGDRTLMALLTLAACGVVTFHRAKDVGQGASRRQNLQSVRRCLEILSGGGAVCVFPEGVSHSDAKLRALS